MPTNSKDLCLRYEVAMRDLVEAGEVMRQRRKHVLSAPRTAEAEPDVLLLNKFLCEIAIIKYARPFKPSYWGNHRVSLPSDEFVPAHHRTLHDELIHLRDKVIAHSDSTTQRPFMVPGIEAMFIGTSDEAQQILHHRSDDFLDLINTVRQTLKEKTEQLQLRTPE